MFLRIFLTCLLVSVGNSVAWAEGDQDWLIVNRNFEADFKKSAKDPNRYELADGLFSRTFYVRDGVGAAVGLESLRKEDSILRAVKPEAVVVVDGVSHPVGGLVGQQDNAFLRNLNGLLRCHL